MNATGAADHLRGKRILVAEDEYMLAEDLARELESAGAEVLGPVATVAEGLALATAEAGIDGALLDVNLRDGTIWPVVDALQARSPPVPSVLVTGYDARELPRAYAHLPLREKPIREGHLIEFLAGQMIHRGDSN